jgi:hypothetical protein
MIYGKLKIIDEEKVGARRKVLCLCECGTKKMVSIYSLKNGDTQSCGCLRKQKMKQLASIRFTGKKPSNFIDYTGKKIGIISVLKRIGDRRKNTPTYLCVCECGTHFEQENSCLRRCKYLTCECGYPHHPLRSILQKMIERCENENCRSYQWYGAKGIKVYDVWKKYPIKFIEWAIKNGWKNEKQTKKRSILTIDRIDSDKDYCPQNCQWITLSENSSKAMKDRWNKWATQII